MATELGVTYHVVLGGGLIFSIPAPANSVQVLRAETLALEKSLTPEMPAEMLKELREDKDLPVTLPKFRIESGFGLREPLAALGMTDAFADRLADFSRMSEQPPGHISHVVRRRSWR